MKAALRLGARGLGQVWPNPAVGCLLVREDVILARGRTMPGGRPHAETEALARAGETARGTTAYVSLEPCAHHGATPPCAEALIAAGVARVVYPIDDPDPRVAGDGARRLREAGIDVTSGIAAEEARRVHRGFLSRVTGGRPFVTLKLATSFDGRIATATGQSRWITGPAARAYVHGLRMRHDAVLVGGGTARADDPTLNVRGFGPVRQPVRIVASRTLDLPREGRLAAGQNAGPLWLIHGARDVPEATSAVWEARGATLVPVPVGSGSRLDVVAMMRTLAARGLTRVFCEGGGALAAGLLAAGVVDEVIGFTAGVVLGAEGWPSLGAMGIGALAEAPRFSLVETRAIGGDVLHRWERSGWLDTGRQDQADAGAQPL